MTVILMTNEKTYIGVNADTKPTSPPAGSKFYETDTQDIYVYNGSAWVVYKGSGGLL